MTAIQRYSGITVLVVLLHASPVLAQTASTSSGGGEVTTLTPVDSSPGTTKVAGEFRDFLGADSDVVVTGLRRGESFTLVETVPGATPDAPATTTEVSVQPATGKMGYGNVRHTLELSRFLLQGAGVEQPTGSDLNAVLNGGSVTAPDGTSTEFQGILALRSEGMGWGKIAQEYGVKLGHVKNGRATFAIAPTSTPEDPALPPGEGSPPPGAPNTGSGDGLAGAPTTGSGDPLASTDRTAAPASLSTRPLRSRAGSAGIVDASGASLQGPRGNRRAGGFGSSRGTPKGARAGHGIVDATGASSSGRGIGASGSRLTGRGHGNGRGIVDATGSSIGGHGSGKVHGMGIGGGGRAGRGAGAASISHGGGGGSRGIVNAVGVSSGGGRGHISNMTGGSGRSNGNGNGSGRGHGKNK